VYELGGCLIARLSVPWVGRQIGLGVAWARHAGSIRGGDTRRAVVAANREQCERFDNQRVEVDPRQVGDRGLAGALTHSASSSSTRGPGGKPAVARRGVGTAAAASVRATEACCHAKRLPPRLVPE